VSSGTTALHLALLAAGVGPGDEVITVSHSFIATANVVRYCGAIPVFVDIRPDTLNIDPELVEMAISGRTRAILCVHQLGMPCDLSALATIARLHGIALIEDAACAIGSEILADGAWERIGRPHGDYACFSFHPRKLVTTGDGGMITTRDANRDRWLRLVRQHGMSVPDTVRHAANEVIFEQYPVLGFNYRMTDIQAAVGREQLKKLPRLVERRRELAARYAALLSEIGLEPPVEPEWTKSNWQSYCVRLPQGVDQVQVMQSMLDAGISTRRGVMCSHREPAYAVEPWRCERSGVCDCGVRSCDALSNSETLTARGLILPLYVGMTDAIQGRVVAALAEATTGYRS
jgi:dTDP-4-amino-4,6-dideoxygalactose transaminase